MAGLTTALIVGGATLGAAKMQSDAAKKASKQAANAAAQANATQQQVYDTTTAQNKPYYEAGTGAVAKLNKLYGLDGKTPDMSVFQASPDYQFTLDQGNKNIMANAAAAGGLNSGATLKALQTYGQNTASSQFNSYVSRLQSLAGMGQAAVNTNASAGQNYANQTGANTINAANQQGNAALASANGWANALGTISGGLSSYLGNKNSFQSSYGQQPGLNAAQTPPFMPQPYMGGLNPRFT